MLDDFNAVDFYGVTLRKGFCRRKKKYFPERTGRKLYSDNKVLLLTQGAFQSGGLADNRTFSYFRFGVAWDEEVVSISRPKTHPPPLGKMVTIFGGNDWKAKV